MTNEIMSDVIAVLRKGQEKYTILRKKKQFYELYDKTRKRSSTLRNFKQNSRGRP